MLAIAQAAGGNWPDASGKALFELLAGTRAAHQSAQAKWLTDLKTLFYPTDDNREVDQAESWKAARRVVAKVEHHPGELFSRVGFIVTNLTLPSRAVVRFYNMRGKAEQWIKEGKQAVKMTRLSCQRFGSNEVRLWLSVIAQAKVLKVLNLIAILGCGPRKQHRGPERQVPWYQNSEIMGAPTSKMAVRLRFPSRHIRNTAKTVFLANSWPSFQIPGNSRPKPRRGWLIMR